MKRNIFLPAILLLLAATLAACSADYDEPEQPTTRQDEMPADSTNADSSEDAERGYTVISTVPASDEVKAFFDEALPVVCDTNILGDWVKYIGDFRLNEPVDLMTYSIISDMETFKSVYTGDKTLPQIDFSKYSLAFGRYLLGIDERVDSINIRVFSDRSLLILHTTSMSMSDYGGAGYSDFYYGGIEARLKSFWGIFPKDLPEISRFGPERTDAWRVESVATNSSLKAFFDEALPNEPGTPAFAFSPGNETEFYVINNKEELKSRYTGEGTLPEIDFSQYTLIIGRAYMPSMTYYVKSLQVVTFKDTRTLYVFAESSSSKYPSFYDMYFWGLFPKIEQEITNINIRKTEK